MNDVVVVIGPASIGHALALLLALAGLFGFTMIAVLGFFSAIVVKFSGSAPHIPFWGALLLVGCCGVSARSGRARVMVLGV